MKLVVFSDNHRNISSIEWIVKEHSDADRIISLGDSELREHELTNLGVFGVRGNYPFEPDFPYDLVMEFEGVKTFITHGHRYFVKTGLYNLAQEAQMRECGLVLYGHTHQHAIQSLDQRLYVNPGSTQSPKSGNAKTYAIIEIDLQTISIEIREIFTARLIQKHIEPRRMGGKHYGF
jgi:hypothetical protein